MVSAKILVDRFINQLSQCVNSTSQETEIPQQIVAGFTKEFRKGPTRGGAYYGSRFTLQNGIQNTKTNIDPETVRNYIRQHGFDPQSEDALTTRAIVSLCLILSHFKMTNTASVGYPIFPSSSGTVTSGSGNILTPKETDPASQFIFKGSQVSYNDISMAIRNIQSFINDSQTNSISFVYSVATYSSCCSSSSSCTSSSSNSSMFIVYLKGI